MVISAADAGKHIGEKVTVCDTVVGVSMNRNSNTTIIDLGNRYHDEGFKVICRNEDTSDFKDAFVHFITGQRICVVSSVKEIDGRPAMEISDSELITVHKVSILGNTVKHHRVTNVVLAPPPGAHYFGERYKAVSLTEINKAGTDTIKITDAICSYKMKKKTTSIYIGGSYPNQKLIIIIKGMAKQYFDEMLKMEYRGSDVLHVLNGKKFMCIGKITRFKEIRQMVISDPNGFAIVN